MASRSRTSSFASSIALLLALLALSCGEKKAAIAELKQAAGPIDRKAASSKDWGGAKVGAKFYLGDAARTAEGGAQLEIIGNAMLAMQPHTILRFGGTEQASKIAVELGTIELTGTGSFGFDLGDVRLSRNGTVRITANPGGKPKVELTIGEAQVSTLGGETIDLVIGNAVEIGLEIVDTRIIDAGVPDAPAATPDAAVVAEGAAIEATGKKVEIQLPGETKWVAVAGTGNLPRGAKLRVGTGSSAKLTSQGTTLELAGGARIAMGETGLVLEAGELRVSATTDTTLALPGGTLALAGTPSSAAAARLEIGRRGDAKVTITRGTARLTGTSGSELAMNRGESASLAKAGTIRVLEAIPGYFDFRVTAGETFTIHDPRPPTAVQFLFGDRCPAGGVIEMDRNAQYRTAKVSAGKATANLAVGPGGWAYRLRCTAGGDEGAAVASGRIVVLRDDGRRRLPKNPPLNSIDADGRTWRISYQSQIPNLQVHARGATGAAFKLHLATEGKEQTFAAKKPAVTVPGTQLKEGTYTYWFDIDGVKQPKPSTLKIDFDQTAPQVYIEAPVNGRPWNGDIDVRGAVLPGWTAAVEGLPVPIDKARRFIAKVGRPPGNALAIKLSHPQRGVHYYLRRGKK
jgi:hypothetical protein